MRELPHLPAWLRRWVTSFGGSAAVMLNAARPRQPQDLPPQAERRSQFIPDRHFKRVPRHSVKAEGNAARIAILLTSS